MRDVAFFVEPDYAMGEFREMLGKPKETEEFMLGMLPSHDELYKFPDEGPFLKQDITEKKLRQFITMYRNKELQPIKRYN